MSDMERYVSHVTTVAYWRPGVEVEGHGRALTSGGPVGVVTVGQVLRLQHDDPKALRALADACNRAAFELDIEIARAARDADEVCVQCGGGEPFVFAGPDRLCESCATAEVAS